MANPAAPKDLTPVEFEHSNGLGPLLDQLGLSVIVSTYQAGKVITVGVHEGKPDIRFYHFDQAMGVTRTPTGLLIGSRRQVWSLVGNPDVGRQVEPAGRYDVAFITRFAFHTGPVMGHEMGWGRGQPWFVNTLFNCLCVLNADYNFVPKWKPPFISALAPEDRCHLNGLAMEGEDPRYVTCLGETDTAGGWRPGKATGGCVIDLRTDRVVVRELCMPHSPRVHNGQVFVLNSGVGQVCRVDAAGGRAEPIATLNGYCRGMDVWGQYAFVGLSRIRETSVFGGIPIAEKRDQLNCGVAVVDLRDGRVVGFLHFLSGVEEVFEVKVIPGFRCPIVSGPLPDTDQTEPVWLAPPLRPAAPSF